MQSVKGQPYNILPGSMISVQEAMDLILAHTRDYGNEYIPLNEALGRVVGADLMADRDLPPYNRVTMDGIAIRYDAFAKGLRKFSIIGIQAAGSQPLKLESDGECIEIMTGAVVPDGADTIIRYEDIENVNGIAHVLVEKIKRGQNIHWKGQDKKNGDVVCKRGAILDPVMMSVASSVGACSIPVRKHPKITVISTGNELVRTGDQPEPYQIRSSNRELLQHALKQYHIDASVLHFCDERQTLVTNLSKVLNENDVVILTGGVSKGKFDFLPGVLNELSVRTIFHKVQQKPGKPFWFGEFKEKTLVFALPGNPVSTILCLYRYLIPWLESCLGIRRNPIYARLQDNLHMVSSLTYFLPVALKLEGSCVKAVPVSNNGSGDFASLAGASGFMELPPGRDIYSKDEDFRMWLFNPIN